jgi:hypothetical protein
VVRAKTHSQWKVTSQSCVGQDTLGSFKEATFVACPKRVLTLSVIAIPDDSRSHIGCAKTEDDLEESVKDETVGFRFPAGAQKIFSSLPRPLC